MGKIQLLHVGKSGSGFQIFSFLELSLSHQKPSLVEKRIVFLLTEPYTVLFGLALVAVPFRTLGNGVLLDCFLAFLYGSVEIGFSDADSGLIASYVHRNDVGVVVLVAVDLCKTTIKISYMSVVISIVSGFECLNGACHTCILIV